MRISIIFIWIALAASGCTSGYEKFYIDESSNRTGIVNVYATEPLEVFSSSGDWEQDIIKMYENGYVSIGSASFNGALEGKEGLKKQALKVGADVVVASSKFTDSTTSVIPITTINPVTTYHSGNVTTHGGSSISHGSYSGSSTAYVSATTYIPITREKYDQSAIFFRKMLPSCIGTMNKDISVHLRQKIGTNSGVLVDAVRIGAPSYNANIIPGDIILEVDGHKFYPGAILDLNSGETVSLTLWRDGKILKKKITSGICS